MSKAQKYDKLINLRIGQEEAKKLEEIAEIKERTLSGQVRLIIKNYLKNLEEY